MNPLEKFRKSFLRKRHSRGFGVHSPYAFRFVNEVIRPKQYGYYAYDIIEDNPTLSPRIASRGKWFVRLAVFLQTKRFVVTGLRDKEAVAEAAKALNIGYIEVKDFSREKIKPGDLLVIGSSLKDKGSLSKIIETGVPVLSLNPDSKLREFLVIPLANGLLLEDKDKLLLIPRKEMNFVAYDINF